MNLKQLTVYLDDAALVPPTNKTDIVYQGKGFAGVVEHDLTSPFKATHCWSPVAGMGCDIHVQANAGTPLTEKMYFEYIEKLKELSPNIRKQIEELPPEHTPCRVHFKDFSGKTGYPQYLMYVLWKNSFANPKGVPFFLYLTGLGYDVHEAFCLLMHLTKFWYTTVYGGRILEYRQGEPCGSTLADLRRVDEMEHQGNYGMGGSVGTNFPTKGKYTKIMDTNSIKHIKTVEDLTKKNLDLVIANYR